jgi:hypothetical protein
MGSNVKGSQVQCSRAQMLRVQRFKGSKVQCFAFKGSNASYLTIYGLYGLFSIFPFPHFLFSHFKFNPKLVHVKPLRGLGLPVNSNYKSQVPNSRSQIPSPPSVISPSPFGMSPHRPLPPRPFYFLGNHGINALVLLTYSW